MKYMQSHKLQAKYRQGGRDGQL